MKREKRLLAIAVIVAVVFMAYHFALRPTMGEIEDLRAAVPRRSQNLETIRMRSREYRRLLDEMESLRLSVAKQPGNFGILSYLEQLAGETGLEKNVAHMKPATAPVGESFIETSVRIELEKTSLKNITDFLGRIESSKALIGVKSLTIRSSPRTAGLLDADIMVTTLSLSGQK
jgi:Tfp pilus assembly protein PilO